MRGSDIIRPSYHQKVDSLGRSYPDPQQHAYSLDGQQCRDDVVQVGPVEANTVATETAAAIFPKEAMSVTVRLNQRKASLEPTMLVQVVGSMQTWVCVRIGLGNAGFRPTSQLQYLAAHDSRKNRRKKCHLSRIHGCRPGLQVQTVLLLLVCLTG